MYLPEFQYISPKSTDELASLLEEHGKRAKILSGGTDLQCMFMKFHGFLSDESVIV